MTAVIEDNSIKDLSKEHQEFDGHLNSKPCKDRHMDHKSRVCEADKQKTLDEFHNSIKAFMKKFPWMIHLYTSFNQKTGNATTNIECHCRECKPNGRIYCSHSDPVDRNSIMCHLVEIGMIMKCELDGEYVFKWNLADHVRKLDNKFPEKATSAFWCSSHKKYFSYPHNLSCEHCHMCFSSTVRMHKHCETSHSRKFVPKSAATRDRDTNKLYEDFPSLPVSKKAPVEHHIFVIIGENGKPDACPCGEHKTVTPAVFEKMCISLGLSAKLVDEAKNTGFASGISGRYARCWTCQKAYQKQMQQQKLTQQQIQQQKLTQQQMQQQKLTQQQMQQQKLTQQQMQQMQRQFLQQMLPIQNQIYPLTDGYEWTVGNVVTKFGLQMGFIIVPLA